MKLEWWLHSAEAVWELLKKGKIRVAMKWADGEWWPELTYEEFMRLENVETKKFKIVWADQEVSENPRRWPGEKKTLFPKDWTKEDIAKAFEKAEEKIENGLLEEYWLPRYSPENAGKYWKKVAEEEWIIEEWEWIKTIVNVNWKEIEIEIWWKYDSEWNLDLTIQTIYPYKE